MTSKEAKTNIANNGVTPLMTNTNHNTVQKSVLVDMQNNFMGNPYNVDNTHSPSTGSDQMILLLGFQVRIYSGCNQCCLYLCTYILKILTFNFSNLHLGHYPLSSIVEYST